MDGEDGREENGRQSERSLFGRTAPEMSLEQNQTPIRPWASGGIFPGNLNLLSGPSLDGQFLAIHMPSPPTPGARHPFVHGMPSSAAVSGVTSVPDFTRFHMPPISGSGSNFQVPTNIGPGQHAPLPSSASELLERELEGVVIGEGESDEERIVNNLDRGRVAGGVSPPHGMVTRAGTRRLTEPQTPTTSSSPTKTGFIQEEEVETTRKRLEMDEENYEETNFNVDGNSNTNENPEMDEQNLPPWASELSRLLRQIKYSAAHARKNDEDPDLMIMAMERCLGRAENVIETLVKRNYDSKKKRTETQASLEQASTEIHQYISSEKKLVASKAELEIRVATLDSRCRKLADNLAQAEQQYTNTDSLRTQLEVRNRELEDQIKLWTEGNEPLRATIQSLGTHMNQYRNRLRVYSKQAADLAFKFDADHPPVNRFIVNLLERQQTQPGSRPTFSAHAAPFIPGQQSAAGAFVSTMPPVISSGQPGIIPSPLASTQPTTSSTQMAAQPIGVAGSNTPKLPKPRSFNVSRGGSCFMDFKKWIAEIRSYMALTKVDPSLWAECAAYYLEGFARDRMWKELLQYQNQHHSRMTFEDFCQFMQNKVIPPRNPALAGMQMERIIYQSGVETVAAFKDRLLDNLQVQKGDVPLSDVDFETAKVMFLNKLPESYKVFIYRQNWVMENPTLDNYQKAAEMYEASNELGGVELRGRSQTYQANPTGQRNFQGARSRSRPRNWNFANRQWNRGGASGFSGRKPAGRSPARARTNLSTFNRARSRSNSPVNRDSSPRPQQLPGNMLGIRCYACGEYGHFPKDCTKRKAPAPQGRTTQTRSRSKSPGTRARVHNIQLADASSPDTVPVDVSTETSTDSDHEQTVMFIGQNNTTSIPCCCMDGIVWASSHYCWSPDPQCGIGVIEDLNEDPIQEYQHVIAAMDTTYVTEPGPKIIVAIMDTSTGRSTTDSDSFYQLSQI